MTPLTIWGRSSPIQLAAKSEDLSIKEWVVTCGNHSKLPWKNLEDRVKPLRLLSTSTTHVAFVLTKRDYDAMLSCLKPRARKTPHHAGHCGHWGSFDFYGWTLKSEHLLKPPAGFASLSCPFQRELYRFWKSHSSFRDGNQQPNQQSNKNKSLLQYLMLLLEQIYLSFNAQLLVTWFVL